MGYSDRRDSSINEERIRTEPLPKKIRSAAGHLLFIVRLVWDANPALLCGMVALSVLDGVFPLAQAFIAGNLINILVEIAGTHSVENLGRIVFLLVLQLAYMILSRVTSRLSGTMTHLAGLLVTGHIKTVLAKKAKEVDLANFDLPSFYEKLENARAEASSRPVSIINAMLSFCSKLISTVSFTVLLGAVSPLIPLGIVILSLPSAVINFKYKKISYKYIKAHTNERRRMNYCANILTNKDQVKEVKLLRLHDIFIDRYKTLFKAYYTGIKKIFLREDLLHILVHIASTLVNCAFFLFIAYKVCFDNMPVGDYTIYTGALTSILSGIAALVNNSSTIYEGTLFIDNMIDYLKVEPTVVPSVDPPRKPENGIPHTIEFCNVSFAYPGTEPRVIDRVSFKLEGGKSYVLVGLNGAGKTTLIKLMTRLYDPTEGEILLDGVNIKEYDVGELYDLFGIVFQDFAKYAVSLRENITFGDATRPVDEARLEYAAKQSCADEFIERLPRGYDTPLMRFFEDDAVDLSIGQWQKVSIARAFYKDAEILILDEPTASLDPMAEAEIFRQFDTLRAGKTTVFVSHRLSSATDADDIIVMQRGRIIEEGDHKTLMEKGGAYYKLFTLQAEKYLENC